MKPSRVKFTRWTGKSVSNAKIAQIAASKTATLECATKERWYKGERRIRITITVESVG